MSGRHNLRKALEASTSRKEDRKPYYSGLLGTLHGGKNIVEVAGKHGYVWVRLRNQVNELIQAFNDTVSLVYGLPVLVQRDEYNPTRYRIVGRDIGRYSDWGSNSAFLPKHGNQHSFTDDASGGGDVTWVYGRQLMPLAPVPSGTAGAGSLVIEPYTYYWKGNWRHGGGTGTADITVDRPTGTFARMVLVYLDTNGNPATTVGGYFDESITGTAGIVSYIPPLPISDGIAIAGVRLTSGTTILDWDNIYDLRPWIVGGAYEPTGSYASYNHTHLQYAITGSYAPISHTHPEYAVTGTKLDDWAAPDDNTDLNASTGSHGLLPKLGGDASKYLNGVGAWTTPPGSGTGSSTVIVTEVDNAPSVTVGTIKFPNGSVTDSGGGVATVAFPATHDAVTISGTSSIALQLSGQELSAYILPAGVKLDDWASPDDNTDLNATTGSHGLLPKLAGGTTKFLRSDGTWQTITGTSGGSGDVIGPDSAVDGHLAVFDGPTGKLLKDGGSPTGTTSGSDPIWYIDGALATGTQLGQTYISPRESSIQNVYVYCENPGTGSSTIVDVHKNGTTIFTTQGNRPTLAYNDADKVVKSAVPDVVGLAEGDILTIDIDQVAMGARGLSVIVALGTIIPTSTLPRNVVFTVDGTLQAVANPLRFYNTMVGSQSISKVHLAVNTPPTGQPIIVDVHKNGTTIFTNQANRPQIATGSYTGQTTSIDVAAWTPGDYLTTEIDQVGSSVVGSDLTVTLSCS